MSHTTQWVGEGVNDGVDVTYVHNGDYSGNVEIIVTRHEIGVEVSVPFAALEFIVAEAVRSRRIEALEQAEPREILR